MMDTKTRQMTENNPPKQNLSIRVIVTAFLLLLVFLSLIAWALQRTRQGSISIGQHVNTFTLTTSDGKTINTADLEGKIILVNFWASWCQTCEQEAADLQAAWRTYQKGGDVLFLGVDYVDTESEAKDYLDKFGITYPNGPDLRSEISDLFRIRGVPETFIIDRQGNLAFIKIGPFSSLSEIQSMINELLK